MPLCPSKTWRWLLNVYNLKDLQVSNHKHPSINTHDSVTASKWQTSWEHLNQTASKASHFTWCTLQLAWNGCWDAWLHTIRTHPDLVCVCGQRAQLEELDRVLFNSPSAQLLSYDTTFQLGDFYVSILCFRHTLFKEAPVILAAFLVHERKFEEHHKELFCVCTKLVRSLNHTTCPMVTDEEVAIVNAVVQVIPQVPQLRCWNHIFRAVMAWLRKHGAPCQDISVYLSDIRDLFHLPTEDEYDNKLASLKQRWSAPFSDYYTNHIHPDNQLHDGPLNHLVCITLTVVSQATNRNHWTMYSNSCRVARVTTWLHDFSTEPPAVILPGRNCAWPA